MSGLRQKQNATTKKNSTTRNVNTRGGGSTIREVESPQKSRKKNGPPRDDEDNARADAIAEARRDAEAEIEAVEHHGDVTPPPEIPARVLGPAASRGMSPNVFDRDLGRKQLPLYCFIKQIKGYSGGAITNNSFK
jgi:hypothetical protein